MAKKDTAENTASETKPESTFKVEILTNGILIGDAHHAAGKIMSLPQSQVDALVAIDPPAVKIIGV